MPRKSVPVNYSFFMGASNHNLDEVLKTDPTRVCGIKVFMGSSTGDMLVDESAVLEGIFKEAPTLVATHCEDEATVRANSERPGRVWRDGAHCTTPAHSQCRGVLQELVQGRGVGHQAQHPACTSCTSARRASWTCLTTPALEDKRITAEACIHHLWFSDVDYESKGTHIKWNPAVKTAHDREQIRAAILDGRIDVVATDHAPHTKEEKNGSYFKAPSGGPLVQHALVAMLDMVHDGSSARRESGRPDGPPRGAVVPHERPRIHPPWHEGRPRAGAPQRPLDRPRRQRHVQVRMVSLHRAHVQEPRARDLGQRHMRVGRSPHHNLTRQPCWTTPFVQPLSACRRV